MVERIYRLTVEGELGDDAALAFDGMAVDREKGMTVLEGRMHDQAQLQGILQRVSDLGLTLISATAVDDEA